MNKRSAFDEYLFGGGLEADAKKGVAEAIARLEAAGITPSNRGPIPTATAKVEQPDDGGLSAPDPR